MVAFAVRARTTGALALAAVVGGVAVATALAAATYRDAAGDVRGGRGPDLTSIAVSHTASAVTFRVTFAQAPPLRASASGGWVDMLLLGIDLPPRGARPTSTHEWRGIDLAVGLHGTDTVAMIVRAPKWKLVARVKARTTGSTLSFSIPRRTLGNPATFDFNVAAGRETSRSDASGGEDYAPSAGTYRYRLTR